jgi:hypothetical protein
MIERAEMTVARPALPVKDSKNHRIHFNNMTYVFPEENPELVDAMYNNMCEVLESGDGRKLIQLLQRLKQYRTRKKYGGGRQPNVVRTESEHHRIRIKAKLKKQKEEKEAAKNVTR